MQNVLYLQHSFSEPYFLYSLYIVHIKTWILYIVLLCLLV